MLKKMNKIKIYSFPLIVISTLFLLALYLGWNLGDLILLINSLAIQLVPSAKGRKFMVITFFILIAFRIFF